MLGSLQDAEDVLQETLLAAWQGFGRFEKRASLRTWLYKIATNRCLNARRSARRRPAKAYDVPGVQPPEPTRLGEVTWLKPFPDELLERAIDVPPDPEVRYGSTESISLTFVTALQILPHRQLAVLLCDLLGFEASEVANMLESTVDSVTSALKRARANLQQRRPASRDRQPPPAPGSPSEDAIAAKFVCAWESADVDAVVALLTDDVFSSRCRRSPTNTRAETSQPASARASSTRVGGTTSFRREPTVSLRSESTCAPTPASAKVSASTSSRSAATGSAP